ncbi:MAG: transcription antitermination factor NusB [Halioglobus sp.]|nr:transcription antitermination factor NusB [Halioglobus sp.]
MAKAGHNTLGAERRKARHYGMQALYQWYMAQAPLADIEAEFLEDYDFAHVDTEYFHDLLHSVPARVEALDAAMAPYLDRPLSELDPIEHTLLRIGLYELTGRVDVPFKVVINEAVALAKKFGATDSHKFVNGVLDRAARDLRKVETDAAS